MKRRILKTAANWGQVTFDFDTDLELFSQIKKDGWLIIPRGSQVEISAFLPTRPLFAVGYIYSFSDKEFTFNARLSTWDKYEQYFNFPEVIPADEFLVHSKLLLRILKKINASLERTK